jgi:membrane protein
MWQLLRATFEEWQNDHAARLAAALSYYTVFSLTPLLILVISIVGLVIGMQEAQGQVIKLVAGYVGEASAGLIEGLLQQLLTPRNNIAAAAVGGVALLFGATGMFGELQSSLNTIWNVKPPNRSAQQGIRTFIFTRVLSFGMVLAVGFLLLVSLFISTAINAAGQSLFGDAQTAAASEWLDFVLGFFAVALLFALIFKFLPHKTIHWRDVWLGAGLTALLFSLGRLAISLYLSHSFMVSIYGAAGSLVVLLLWVYYSAQILFFGAEFTKVVARRRAKQAENTL